MTVKIITCHHVYNPGASLQAHALQKYISEVRSADVEIIDYRPEYLTEEYLFFGVPNKKYSKNFLTRLIYIAAHLGSKIKFLQRKRCFDRFKRDYLRLTDETYGDYNALMSAPPKADVFIAGSDQIWNMKLPNGKDPAFYLRFTPNGARKFSYAASFGQSKIEKEDTAFLSEMLKDFDMVSVREADAVTILQNIRNDALQVCDPVFLLKADYWKTMADKSKKKIRQPYVFLYDFDDGALTSEVADITAKKHNLPVYTVFNARTGRRSCYSSGPLEFLNYILNADYIVTNSFHAIAFSVIFGKQFYTTLRKEQLNSRLTDFLQGLDLSNRIISNINDLTDECIDYVPVWQKLGPMIKASEKYIARITENE